MADSYPTLEDYCAERTGRETAPALDVGEFKVAAHHVLGYYGQPGGYEPGAFTCALIRCWELADTTNQFKLLSQWPELGQAIYLRREGNTDGLRSITEGKAP